MAKKTWAQKYETTNKEVVETIERAYAGMPAGSKMLISTPAKIEAAIRAIPRGRSIPIPELRARLALDANAELTCPLTTSIFIRIAAEKNWDEHESGKPLDELMPVWRVVGPKDAMANKLRCGAEFLADMRKDEGIA